MKIYTLFNGDDDRTVAELANKYQDRDFLIGLIEQLIKGVLSAKNITGKKVLLKPNWVRHSLKDTDEVCLRTHDAFVLAALEAILKMAPRIVVLGDAPIQGCDWGRMLSENFIDSVNQLSTQFSIPVIVKDFRKVTFNTSSNQLQSDRNPDSEYLIFDLGKESYLEPVTSTHSNNFRVTCYNPDRLAESHGPGLHRYCITREVFDSDVIISLPKVKTHQKAGITAALKNLVGINGDKDFLPHHRLGGTGVGGDCYPGKSYLRYWSELAIDHANRNRGKTSYRLWQKLSSLLWKLSFPKNVHQIAAGWYGNDTTWRMVLDLNRIAVYGTADGKVSAQPQREVYSLCDGIIGGQGNGPLEPNPLPLGVICFSNDSYFTDRCLARLMGFDPDKIPLLHASKSLADEKGTILTLNGSQITSNSLIKYSIPTIPPPGWIGHL